MLYQGIIGGGSSPVEPVDLSPVLLWTNSSPTNDFAAQTVSLDLTEYAGVIIEFKHYTVDDLLGSRIYCKKTDDFSNKIGAGFKTDYPHARNILAVNNSGVQFDDNYRETGSTINNSNIPMKIYGVKQYVVEPVGTQMKISASSNNGTENYGQLNIENCKFNKLKIISYENIGNSFTDYPKITVGEAIYKRPSVGTVIDVLNKNVEIAALASVSGYATTGILVEFL